MITEFEFDVRAQGDALPIETFTFDADLTGHTIHLVIDGLGEIEGEIGTVTPESGDTPAQTPVTFTPSAEVISADPGRYRCSIVVDKDDPASKETIGASWWIVVEYPG